LALPHGARATSVAGILCSIEPESGRVRQAALLGGEPVDRHPDTGTRIIDASLPYWQESVALVLRAHAAAFARFPFLGWDIALTPNGPLLLETNSGWGALFHQMLDGPLGHTAFSRLVALRVQRQAAGVPTSTATCLKLLKGRQGTLRVEFHKS